MGVAERLKTSHVMESEVVKRNVKVKLISLQLKRFGQAKVPAGQLPFLISSFLSPRVCVWLRAMCCIKSRSFTSVNWVGQVGASWVPPLVVSAGSTLIISIRLHGDGEWAKLSFGMRIAVYAILHYIIMPTPLLLIEKSLYFINRLAITFCICERKKNRFH